MHTFRAPARIALFLRVVGQHTDGSPKFLSLNQTIDLCDDLVFEHQESDSFSGDSPYLQDAILLYRKTSRVSIPLSIKLRIHAAHDPSLGFHFSHAATALWGLNELSGNPLSISELKAIAAEIHPEVSFFFSEGAAKCDEHGQVIQELAPFSQRSLSIFYPPYKVPHTMIYRRLALDDLQDRDVEKSIADLTQGKSQYHNDLEEFAFVLNPKLGLIKQKLLTSGFSTAVMAGTGPAFFCLDSSAHSFTFDKCFQTSFLNRKPGEWY
jgi:4-diphosphocytidyl-2-C-methyl-D-erythritol kinase